MGQTFREVSKLTPAALWSSTELSMVGVETSTGVGHPKKLVQRASRGLGKTFFTRKKPVKYAMDGLLVRLGPLQRFWSLSGDPAADLVAPLVGSMMEKKRDNSRFWVCLYVDPSA
jgi:hypothetical protein